MNFSLLPLGLAVLSGATTLAAVPITDPPRTFLVSHDIPDRSDPPVSFVQNIVDSPILVLSSVVVGLRLVGVTEDAGFAGEMVVSLTRNLADTSLLLNQVGLADLFGEGAPYDGWDVTLRDDAAAGDVHLANATEGVLHGTWQPDGRLLADTEERPAMLDVFSGGPANGEWRLNVADLEFGGRMRLESWSLTFTGFGPATDPEPDPNPGGSPGPSVVPEPSSWWIGAAMLGGWVLVRRRRPGRSGACVA